MTDMEIRSNNVTIAIFMDNWTDHGQEPAYAVYNHKGYEAWELRYHESWDWLMPVAQKIIDLKVYKAGHILRLADLSVSLSRLDINQIYNSICNYIQWYNLNDRSK